MRLGNRLARVIYRKWRVPQNGKRRRASSPSDCQRQPKALTFARSGNYVSLSPGERAGVRAGSLFPTSFSFPVRASSGTSAADLLLIIRG